MAAPTKKVSTAISVKNFLGVSTKEFMPEWKQLDPQDKLDFCDMLPAVDIHPTDRADLVKRLATA